MAANPVGPHHFPSKGPEMEQLKSLRSDVKLAKIGDKNFVYVAVTYELVATVYGFQRTHRAAYHCSNFSMGSTGGKYR